MKTNLKKLGKNTFHTFTAFIFKIGVVENGTKTILLLDVRLKGTKIAPHVWIKMGDAFCSLNIKVSMYIRFKSRIIMYSKKEARWKTWKSSGLWAQ